MADLETLLALTNIPVNVAVLDSAGIIIGVNESWRNFAKSNGARMPDHGIGLSYLGHCGDGGAASAIRSDISRLLHGRLDIATACYPCHSPDRIRWCLMIGLPLARERAGGALLMHANITDLLPIVFSVRELGSVNRPLRLPESVLTLQSIADIVQQTIGRALAGIPSPPHTFASGIPTETRITDEQKRVANARLSPRHRQVFAMLGEGRGNAEIAAALGLSPNTIKVHVSEVLRRLNLDTRMQAALLASTIAQGTKIERVAPAKRRRATAKRAKPP